MANPPLEQATIRRMAALAALDLADDECAQMAAELSTIIEHIDLLKEVNIEGVAAMSHVHLGRTALRPDEPHTSLPQELALAEAAHTDAGGFAVPSFVDEG